jgi:seryl-tRNA synthetase
VFEEKDLETPIRFAGMSPCFRKEIGKHGLDERGFFRVHQFNKIEQVILCKPQDSWKEFDSISKNQETFFQKLEIPYRVVNVCTGDMGVVAAKKYDLECWSPREGKYIELGSCSNCTSYQAVRLNIKYKKADGTREYVHTLNNTMVPTTRTLRVLIETYQTPEGNIRIPKALQVYMNGKTEIKMLK